MCTVERHTTLWPRGWVMPGCWPVRTLSSSSVGIRKTWMLTERSRSWRLRVLLRRTVGSAVWENVGLYLCKPLTDLFHCDLLLEKEHFFFWQAFSSLFIFWQTMCCLKEKNGISLVSISKCIHVTSVSTSSPRKEKRLLIPLSQSVCGVKP